MGCLAALSESTAGLVDDIVGLAIYQMRLGCTDAGERG